MHPKLTTRMPYFLLAHVLVRFPTLDTILVTHNPKLRFHLGHILRKFTSGWHQGRDYIVEGLKLFSSQ